MNLKKKALVAYFSCSGVTKALSETLAKTTDADLFEIKPAVPYTTGDLDWMDQNSRSTLEMKDPDSRPAIAEQKTNMAEYEVVFVGFPVWWYVAPTIINTFLESYDFSEKTIVPFCTSGGSGPGKTDEILHHLCPDSVSWRPCKLLRGHSQKDQLAEWIDSLEIV